MRPATHPVVAHGALQYQVSQGEDVTNDTMLGMGADSDEIRALGGDSGSSLIVGDPSTGKNYVIAITSRGYFSGTSANPSSVALYINVAKHHEWITRTIANDTTNLPKSHPHIPVP